MTAVATTARALAILIAILGVVDPSLTSLRSTSADVVVVATDRADSALARRVADRLDGRYTVVRGPWSNAAATVLVGSTLPAELPSGLTFAVVDSTRPAITRFDVPAAATTEARLVIPVSVNGPVTLRANGVIVDTSSGRALVVTPTSAGSLLLEATVVKGGDSTTVTAVANVVDRRHAVLFFDRRPSWMSTFVRRALEHDRRFAVASRVITSRGVSTDAGQPPSTLADPALLELYDVIVVGAPNLLTPGDISGLDAFLRRRGGSVVLLYDSRPTTGGLVRGSWTSATSRLGLPGAAPGDSAALRLTEAAWPTPLPAAADVRVTARIGATDRPIVWTTGAGAGQIIVNGALDAWKFRDRSTSGFDEFWRATISRAAREVQDAVAVEVSPNVAQPGDRITIRVTTRDTLATPTLTLDSTRIDLWPGERAGEFTTRLRAPALGDHMVKATASGASAEAQIAVRASVARAHRDESGTIRMFAHASGGISGSLDDVEGAIRERVTAEKRLERWSPMRSAWWIVPFTFLLGVEWVIRRRRGLG